jgi:hypothetical protein
MADETPDTDNVQPDCICLTLDQKPIPCVLCEHEGFVRQELLLHLLQFHR